MLSIKINRDKVETETNRETNLHCLIVYLNKLFPFYRLWRHEPMQFLIITYTQKILSKLFWILSTSIVPVGIVAWNP